jgi:hypothetical protein
MTNIMIVIPVVDTNTQNFTNLIDDLSGNYVAENRIETSLEDGSEVETVVVNPYIGVENPDFSGNIILVSHSEIDCPENAQSVVVDGDLNIAKLWNAGIAQASQNGATHVVILNEASSVNPHMFSEAVLECNTPVINLSDGGCFIVTPEVTANETYRWWFADIDLFNNNEVGYFRKDFFDLVQENRIPIEGFMQELVDQDHANFTA